MATATTNPNARTTLEESLVTYRQPTGDDARLRQMARLHFVQRLSSVPVAKS